MAFVIAQLSDIHIGGPVPGSGERFSSALAEIEAMTRPPDLVLLTGDLTHHGRDREWAELNERLAGLTVPWIAMPGNHDQAIAELAGHRSLDAGPLHLALVDSAREVFGADDAAWLDADLSAHAGTPTVVAIHHPPFDTGIWWMDCIGLEGAPLFEQVIRRHPQVMKVLSGHVHRLIQTSWGGCSLWVCPSTSVSVAVDLDPGHHPAETAEAPTFSLHAFTGSGIVSHVVPVGAPAARNPLGPNAEPFIERIRAVQAERLTPFGD